MKNAYWFMSWLFCIAAVGAMSLMGLSLMTNNWLFFMINFFLLLINVAGAIVTRWVYVRFDQLVKR